MEPPYIPNAPAPGEVIAGLSLQAQHGDSGRLVVMQGLYLPAPSFYVYEHHTLEQPPLCWDLWWSEVVGPLRSKWQSVRRCVEQEYDPFS